MKTHVYLSSILSIAIGTMINGQSTVDPRQSNNTYATITSSKKILAPLENDSKPSLNATTPAETTVNSAFSPQLRSFLEQQADDYALMALRLRNLAKTKTGQDRSSLIAEAVVFEQKSEIKQLEAVEMSGSLNLSQYKENRIKIAQLIKSLKPGEQVQQTTKELIRSSEKNMKLATEMREEAHADANRPSRLGALTNAEEKEQVALNEQSQAILELGEIQSNRPF